MTSLLVEIREKSKIKVKVKIKKSKTTKFKVEKLLLLVKDFLTFLVSLFLLKKLIKRIK